MKLVYWKRLVFFNSPLWQRRTETQLLQEHEQVGIEVVSDYITCVCFNGLCQIRHVPSPSCPRCSKWRWWWHISSIMGFKTAYVRFPGNLIQAWTRPTWLTSAWWLSCVPIHQTLFPCSLNPLISRISIFYLCSSPFYP